MTTFVKRLCTLFLTGAMALLIVTLAPAAANAQGKESRFCKKLFNPTLNPHGRIFASQGAQMYCFGSQLNFASKRPQVLPSPSRIKNVDAADPGEDISPNGTQAFGQSETSIAAADRIVVGLWT